MGEKSSPQSIRESLEANNLSRTETSLRTTHLAMTSDISTAATCGWKYRLPKIFGVPTSGSFGGLVGWAVHDVLSRSGGAVHETWNRATNGSRLMQLRLAIEPAKQEVFSAWREK